MKKKYTTRSCFIEERPREVVIHRHKGKRVDRFSIYSERRPQGDLMRRSIVLYKLTHIVASSFLTYIGEHKCRMLMY